MAKGKKKKGKKIPKEPKELSEWQKRNQEYLQRKAEEEAALAEEKEKERQARMGEMSEKAEENGDQESESNSKESELEKGNSEEKLEDSEETKDKEEKLEDSKETKGKEETKDKEETEEKEEVKSKNKKKQEKKNKKAEKKSLKEKPLKPRIPGVHIWRALTILLPSIFVFLISLYLLSPYATKKDIHVEGTNHTTAEEVRQAAAIEDSDYMLSLLLNKARYEEKIKSDYWIESAQLVYQFPTKFTIKVKEFYIVAYYVSGDSHYPILSSGKLENSAVSLVTLPEKYLSVMFNDSDKIKTFISELSTVSPEIKSAIQKVELVSSKTTTDLLRLTMADSDEILVPLSEIGKKLPFYSKIKSQLSEPNVIDMEAGIFSYTVADKQIIEAEEKAKKEAVEAEKKQIEEEKQRLEEQKNKLEEEKKKLEEEISQNQTSRRSQRR